MKVMIGNSDSYIADVKDLKERLIIDEDNIFKSGISCAICNNTSDNHDLWFILTDAGSGSMDDYICSDCIKKISDSMELIKLSLKQKKN